VVVRDDEDALSDSGTTGRSGEVLGPRERVSTPSLLDIQIRQLVDPEERCTWNVLLGVRLAPGFDAIE
jgi:hypothetical protein